MSQLSVLFHSNMPWYGSYADEGAAVVTRGMGRAQAPDITLGGVSGTISSSSLYQWKVVSFFTLATWKTNTRTRFIEIKERPRDEKSGKLSDVACYLAGEHNGAVLSDSEVQILREMCTWKHNVESGYHQYEEHKEQQWMKWNIRNTQRELISATALNSECFQMCVCVCRHLASWCALSSGTRLPSEQLWTQKQRKHDQWKWTNKLLNDPQNYIWQTLRLKGWFSILFLLQYFFLLSDCWKWFLRENKSLTVSHQHQGALGLGLAVVDLDGVSALVGSGEMIHRHLDDSCRHVVADLVSLRGRFVFRLQKRSWAFVCSSILL